MASYGYTFQSGDGVTPTRLNDARTVSDIVNADIKSDAAIAGTKLASDSITNTQIKSDAAIAGTKIAPDFGSQNVVTSGSVTALDVSSRANDSSAAVYTSRASSDGGPPYVVFDKSRGTQSSKTAVQSADQCGQLLFRGYDGTGTVTAAVIACYVDGTPGTNDMPGRLSFWTTADGASSPTERMRITAFGTALIGKTSDNVGDTGVTLAGAGYAHVTRDGSVPLTLNRLTNDGSLLSLRQAGVEEGSITVSGSTVSYNGAHLSRWSQLPSGAARQEILRGTVMSNIDEMCVWGDDQNEQLNRMKVSDVEGDHNAAGVFQSWDDDDDTYTNDFYCAMTGDFVIRIAAGTTVQRGDLLVSAGDGTAKPQGDDIVRSKTVAKVTSTQPSCTYADGSYCVPCVLMAC